MVYGIGIVRIYMIMGFIAGFYLARINSASGNSFIQFTGLVSLTIGIIGMVGINSPIKGQMGGLLTGFGLGATLGSLPFPTPT